MNKKKKKKKKIIANRNPQTNCKTTLMRDIIYTIQPSQIRMEENKQIIDDVLDRRFKDLEYKYDQKINDAIIGYKEQKEAEIQSLKRQIACLERASENNNRLHMEGQREQNEYLAQMKLQSQWVIKERDVLASEVKKLKQDIINVRTQCEREKEMTADTLNTEVNQLRQALVNLREECTQEKQELLDKYARLQRAYNLLYKEKEELEETSTAWWKNHEQPATSSNSNSN